MIDKTWIGREITSSTLPIEEGRLTFFAKATGQTDPVYVNAEAATRAGYSALPAMPTFLFAAQLDSGATLTMLEGMGVPLGKVLHGEQAFEYLQPVVAGDVITVRSFVENVYDKKGGALEFIEVMSEGHNQADALVVRMRSVLVVRH